MAHIFPLLIEAFIQNLWISIHINLSLCWENIRDWRKGFSRIAIQMMMFFLLIVLIQPSLYKVNKHDSNIIVHCIHDISKYLVHCFSNASPLNIRRHSMQQLSWQRDKGETSCICFYRVNVLHFGHCEQSPQLYQELFNSTKA